MSKSESRYSVFLSHNGLDKAIVEALANRLRAAGLRPWLDKWELIPGNRWPDGLADGLSVSDTCAVFIGPSNVGNWEAEEISLAHLHAVSNPEFRLIPVLLPGLRDPFDPSELPPFLKTRTWVDFRKGIDDESAFYHLECGIRGTAPGSSKEVGPAMAVDSEICPYRGLQVFNEGDAPFYFGRDADVQRLLEKLKQGRFLGVLGASGSGKSSLVRAGLLPAIRSGKLPASSHWDIPPVFSPGYAPLEALVLALSKLPNADTGGLLGLLRESERALHVFLSHLCESLRSQRPGLQKVLVVVDQLEEVFTLCDQEHERAQLLANLLYAAMIPNGHCAVVATLRADFYHKFVIYPEFASALAARQAIVGDMRHDGLMQAIEEPARKVGLRFESGLVQTIAGDVTGQPGALPLLEHALLELWRRREGSVLTLKGYIESGRVQGAIARRADAIYESFNDEKKTIMRSIMLRLTQPGDGTDDTRRRATLDELVTRSEKREAVEEVIAVLTSSDHRLLTTDEQRGVSTVEVSHEALIRGWERLRLWLDEYRESWRLQQRLADAAREWQKQTTAGQPDEGLLYRGLQLARALEWRKHHDDEANDAERAFLDASEALRDRIAQEEKVREQQELKTAKQLAAAAEERVVIERKARRRQRYLIAGLTALTLAVSALAYYVNLQYKDSRSRQLAATARRVTANDPFLGVLLATEATSVSPTADAEVALRDSLIQSYNLEAILQGHEEAVFRVAFSPDGKQVVTASLDGTVRIWDASTGQIQRELKQGLLNRRPLLIGDIQSLIDIATVPDYLLGAAFSPDGKQIVGGGSRNRVRVWDVASGEETLQFVAHQAAVVSVCFSPDGKQILSSGFDEAARLSDAVTGTAIREFKGHSGSIYAASFSSDGKRILTTSADKTAKVWDAITGQVLLDLKAQAAVLNGVFSPDGSQVLTSEDNVARLWDLKTKQVVGEFKGHTGTVTSAAFSPDGKQIVTASRDKSVRIWNVDTKWTIAEFDHAEDVLSAVFSPDGHHVVSAGEDKAARIWKLDKRTVAEMREDDKAGFTHVGISPNAQQVFTTTREGRVRVWDIASGKLSSDFAPEGKFFYSVLSDDGSRLVTYGADRIVRVWEVRTGRRLYEFSCKGEHVNLSLSSDGKMLMIRDQSAARVWNLSTGEMMCEDQDDGSGMLSPDGKWLLASSVSGSSRLWNVREKRLIATLDGKGDAVFSPDGTKVAAAGAKDQQNYTIRVWHTSDGKMIHELKESDPVFHLRFSPNGKMITLYSSALNARVWDVDSGKRVLEIRGGSHPRSASFSPDSKRIVVLLDRLIRVLDIESGDVVLENVESPNTIQSVEFSPNGKQLMTVTGKVIRILDFPELGTSDDLLPLAKQRSRRTLTAEERRLYLN